MLTAALTFSQWVWMEKLSTIWIPVCMFGGGALILVAAFSAIYQQRSLVKKWFLGISITLIGVATISGLVMWHLIQPYRTLLPYVSARVRVEKVELGRLVPLDGNEVATMSRLNNWRDLDKLPMYQRQTVAQPVKYLGQSNNTEYFELANKIFSFSGKVQIAPGKETELIGYQFTLSDRRYTKLGFIDPSGISTTTLAIAPAQKKRTYEPPSTVKIHYLQQDGGQWLGENDGSVDDPD
ncbi:hypothetical protein [Lacticaseibacillus yichunensis]|uniref:DUF4131 domain-containing protein n=1 Tax=Lacticaseibacillus yichunensis TaxID=2486015 RepID=A0ABW4CP21_9LACO|nr:hypothetical protein [Lacticaseibacillus yichunensis]